MFGWSAGSASCSLIAPCSSFGSLPRLHLVPQGVERGQVGGADVDAALGRERFDAGEAGLELRGRAAQRQLGVDAEVPGGVDDGEQQVAEFLGDRVDRTLADRPRSVRRAPRASSPAGRRRRPSRSRPSPPCAATAGRAREPADPSARRRRSTSRCFSWRLISSQFLSTASASAASTRSDPGGAKTCG